MCARHLPMRNGSAFGCLGPNTAHAPASTGRIAREGSISWETRHPHVRNPARTAARAIHDCADGVSSHERGRVLSVPAAVVPPSERNLVINPLHSDHAEVRPTSIRVCFVGRSHNAG